MAYLLIGLGNPGKKYETTRHNIGFRVVTQIAQDHQLSFAHGKWSDHTTLEVGQDRIYLVKPTTYMNESGQAVARWVQKKGIPLENIVVIYDDLHLPLGKIRLRKSGGSGGHNGIKSITEKLGSDDYTRLRLGIGNDFAAGRQSEYVLGSFSQGEEEALEEGLARAQKAVLDFVSLGIEAAMQQYN